jgi:Domain of unknown function (DUF4837)
MIKRLSQVLLLSAVTTTVSACDLPLAWGEQNSIIVGTSPEIWAEIEDVIDEALETRVLTVRPEKTFKVTHEDPIDADWQRLQRFRQVLVVGTENDRWVAQALAESKLESFSAPQILQVKDVWARGQTVTIILARPGSVVEDVQSFTEELHENLDARYRRWVENRMFMSGRDTALADTLWRQSRFSVVVPEVYYWRQDADSVFIFRNDNPDPSELIRQITISWRSPIPENVTRDDVLAWRQEIADGYFSYPQTIDTTFSSARQIQLGDMLVDEYQATWTNPPSDQFPAAGPFVLRWVACPNQNRLYLVDAWLYAPAKEKYQYMLQLETILDSFRCAQGGTAAGH